MDRMKEIISSSLGLSYLLNLANPVNLGLFLLDDSVVLQHRRSTIRPNKRALGHAPADEVSEKVNASRDEQPETLNETLPDMRPEAG
jgi:hypothetical protein